MKNKALLIRKINSTLDKIRPYLIADGGDVTFIDVTPEMEVHVKLSGACGDCPFSEHTLKAGVEQSLKQDIPLIKSVIAV
jgi:Fe-S cluster biogenesis protein NfuA